MATTLETPGGTITLPDDMLWVDEMNWSPVTQNDSVTLGGSIIREKGAQTFGRPITLIGEADGPWADTATMDALRAAELALAAVDDPDPMTLTLLDGRTFTVDFLSGPVTGIYNGTISSGPAVSGIQVELRAPNGSDERDTLVWIPVLRFIQVA